MTTLTEVIIDLSRNEKAPTSKNFFHIQSEKRLSAVRTDGRAFRRDLIAIAKIDFGERVKAHC